MEKRNHPRVTMASLSVDISDGVGFFQGTLTDASRFGVCIGNLSKKINGQAKKIVLVVSSQGNTFKCKARPRWTMTDGVSKFIGAELFEPPWGWVEFIMQHEPKKEDEEWGEITI